MTLKKLMILAAAPVVLFSCVSSKKFNSLGSRYAELNNSYTAIQKDLQACRDEKSEIERRKAILEAELAGVKGQKELLKSIVS